jgi:hypothetical protein
VLSGELALEEAMDLSGSRRDDDDDDDDGEFTCTND